MNKKVIPPEPNGVQEIALREALEERYLAYALSTIMHRALPDARDGLKPVHRRILYGMRLLRLDPGAAFKKSAKIVGDVMGNFHPHGDQAIYDALVRLAQDFSSRYPLVDGQGNFGNIDGDNAAAYRYTEARLTEVARLLLDGIDEDAVDFRASYDGVMQEPVVLPAAFPNLLANGSQGIAVGMATSIPPHNAAELCDAALYLIEQPNARSKTLLKYVPGPDFPTGGLVVDPPAAIAEAYASGRGSFRVRARWKTEDTGRGTYQVIVTEIPWQVQKMRLIERIAELINEKKLPLLADMRDESAEDVRIVFEPRSRSVDPALLMESLFKLTELESRVPLNMNVLIRGRVPKVVGLAEALSEWLAHRRDVLLRRSRYRLSQIEHRLEVLGGYLVAYLNLDKVIKIIRKEDEPKPVLMKTFKLSERPGRRHPQYAAAQPAPAGRDGDPPGGQGFTRREEIDRGTDPFREAAVEEDRGADQGSPRPIRAENAARQATHRLCRGARARRCGDRGGVGRARADHRRRFRKGLDSGAARPSGRSFKSCL